MTAAYSRDGMLFLTFLVKDFEQDWTCAKDFPNFIAQLSEGGIVDHVEGVAGEEGVCYVVTETITSGDADSSNTEIKNTSYTVTSIDEEEKIILYSVVRTQGKKNPKSYKMKVQVGAETDDGVSIVKISDVPHLIEPTTGIVFLMILCAFPSLFVSFFYLCETEEKIEKERKSLLARVHKHFDTYQSGGEGAPDDQIPVAILIDEEDAAAPAATALYPDTHN